jgi:predicted metalloprotease with PDZ domain
VQNTPGRYVQSVAQSSFDAWVKYYRPDENTPNATVSYYTKGCLIALALDLTLRHEGKSTLDGVMHTLWRNSRGGPIQESDIAHALAREGQRAYDDELLQWVHGTEELPLSALLQTHNIKLEHDTPTTSQWLGAKLNEQPSGLQVQAVWRQGLAERIGIAPNDELLAFDGWRLRKADDLLRLNAFTQGGSLLIARDQKILTLEFTPGSPPPGAVMLRTEDQNANNVLQKKRRTAWFSGGF